MYEKIETMTDDQLVEYIGKLSTRLGIVSRLAGGSGARDQLVSILNIARAELSNRMNGSEFKRLMAQTPAEIVTDPDLAPTINAAKKAPTRKKQPINRVRVQRSDRPTSSIDLSPSPDNKKDDK